jgi:hypothetical protein
MISTSDNELYLRVGVPDGLQNDDRHEEHYGIVQKAHADPGRSSTKSDSGSNFPGNHLAAIFGFRVQ